MTHPHRRPILPVALAFAAPLACCSAAALGAASVEAAAAAVGADLPRFVGRLHPVLVHFPIALLIVALVFEIVALLVRREHARPSAAALGCAVLGAIGAAAATWAGWLNADLESHGRGVASMIETHRWLGIAVCAFAALAVVCGLIGAAARAGALTGAYRVCLVIAAALVGVAGHWGGTIVYGEGYLTEALFPKPPPPPPDLGSQLAELQAPDGAPPALTVDFATQIFPIFEANCIECHGPNRKKGNLRLDTRYHAFDARAANAQVIIPGDAWASDLHFRVTLPHDDPDAMPPEGDGEPLTPQQVALIETWINEGAIWTDAPLARAPEPPPAETDPRAPLASIPSAALAAAPDLDQRDAALAALRERGAVATPVSPREPWTAVRFDLLDGGVTEADLALLEPLAPTLVSLNLAGTGVTDAHLAVLPALPRLERLHLERTAVTDEGVRRLADLPSLTYLNLYGASVTDHALVTIAQMPALESVYLWRTQVTPAAAALLSTLRPNLAVEMGDPLEAAFFPEEPTAETETVVQQLPDCCAAAQARGEVCDHPCCVEAAAAGKICPTCAG